MKGKCKTLINMPARKLRIYILRLRLLYKNNLFYNPIGDAYTLTLICGIVSATTNCFIAVKGKSKTQNCNGNYK